MHLPTPPRPAGRPPPHLRVAQPAGDLQQQRAQARQRVVPLLGRAPQRRRLGRRQQLVNGGGQLGQPAQEGIDAVRPHRAPPLQFLLDKATRAVPGALRVLL